MLEIFFSFISQRVKPVSYTHLDVYKRQDLDALRTLYEYVVTTLTYDNEKAATVKAGYLPDLDETLKTKTGICFDYAALLTAMLRSLSIPTRLAIGYSGDVKHAWIDVYIESVGWVEKVAQLDGNEWKFMDPTFDSVGKDSEAIRESIRDASNYTCLLYTSRCV